LTERLRRAAPGSQVETYFPASTDALVSRFNEVLAGQTVKEAMTEGMGQMPQRIWVVHDAGALAEHELQLMARLVSNFPGANIRTVLLLGPALRSRKAFESLGRRFVRWDIEAPTPEQALAMLNQARIEGCESLVTPLLRHLQPAVLRSSSASTEPFTFSPADDGPAAPLASARRPSLAAWRQRLQQPIGQWRTRLQALLKWRPSKPLQAGANRPQRLDKPLRKGVSGAKVRWALAVAGLAALSVAVSAWLNGGRFGVSKPAGAQPVKDVRSGAEIKGTSHAVDLLPGHTSMREPRT
jgi:hypothetical protein